MADQKKATEDEITDAELDQIIEDISKDDEVAKASATPQLSVAKAAPPKPKTKDEQALTLELTGVINLKLCFSSGERSIEVFCTEEALLCRMADGTEFRIPTGIPSRKRDVA